MDVQDGHGGGVMGALETTGKATSNQDSRRGQYTDSDYLFTEVCELGVGQGGHLRAGEGLLGQRDLGIGDRLE